MMIKLFAIDDHFLILEGLYKTFDPDLDGIALAGSATTLEEAMEKIPRVKPDIIVLDLFIGDSPPVDNFTKLQQAFPALPIVILTMEDSLRWQIKMFRLGIMGFINKSEPKETMISVFRQVLHGNMVIPDKVSRALITRRGATG